MPRSRSKQHHQCSLRGEAGHNLATCPAPGASTFRRLLREERVRKKTESKQKGRKKVWPVRKSKFGQKKKKPQMTTPEGREDRRKRPKSKQIAER